MSAAVLVRMGEVRRLVLALVVVILVLASISNAFALRQFRVLRSPRPPVIAQLRDDAAGARGWPVRSPHAEPWPEPNYASTIGKFGYREHDVRHAVNNMSVFIMTVKRSGWPLPVIEEAQFHWDWANESLEGPESNLRPRLMPIGLILNPLMIGVPLWVLLFVLPMLFTVRRRRKRQRRGDCVWCGYAMASLAVCPECGRPKAAAGAGRV
jgi:hypothetical protein